jgi:hypothetical protein
MTIAIIIVVWLAAALIVSAGIGAAIARGEWE